MQSYGKHNPSLKRKRSEALRLRFRLVFYVLLSCLVVGCESGFGSKQLGDPMLGISSSPKPVAAPSVPSNTTAQATSGPLPPMPSSYTAPGTAPVAVGETATPENPRSLRMAADTVSPSTAPVAGAARGAAPTVTVGNPELAPAAATANFTKTPAPPPSGSAANIRTYEDAQQFLKQQRVSWQRLDMEDGQWKFECGVPNPSNPRMNRHYATSKASPDPVSAIREVIAQIEKNGP